MGQSFGQGSSQGFGQRATPSVRLRAGMYQAPLSHRKLNPAWPEAIRRLWYSCNTAEGTYIELVDARLHAAPSDVAHLGYLEQLAWQLWHDMESYAAGIVATVEAQ